MGRSTRSWTCVPNPEVRAEPLGGEKPLLVVEEPEGGKKGQAAKR